MTNSVTTSRKALAQVELDNALQAAKHCSKKSRAESTWRVYKSDWRQFEDWCQTASLTSLPADPDTATMFVASQASSGLNPSTRNWRRAAARLLHLGAGHPSPHNALKVVEFMLAEELSDEDAGTKLLNGTQSEG